MQVNLILIYIFFTKLQIYCLRLCFKCKSASSSHTVQLMAIPFIKFIPMFSSGARTSFS